MYPQFNNLFIGEDTNSGSGTTKEPFEFLNEDDVEEKEILDISTPKKDSDAPSIGEQDEDDIEGKEGKESKEEDDELKEIEEELKEPTEEDLEMMTPVRRRDILKKYPQLFKDFPYLEKAYYRERQFTEVFPSIADAKVAVEKAAALDNVEQEVMSGNLTNVLKAAKNESEETFLKIADNYLPALKSADPQAYYHVLGNVIKDTIVTMTREARGLGEQGQPLLHAANILNQFVFGSQNFTPSQPLSRQDRPEDKKREDEWKQQEQQRTMSTFESVRDDLQTRADNTLRATIEANIDPRESMTDFVKKNAIREAHETLESLIGKDRQFRGLLDKLWEKAFRSNFDKESTDRIKSAYISKARTLLPSVVKKARNEALRGMGKRVSSNDDDEKEETTTSNKRGPITPGRSTTPSSGKYKKASDIPKGMTTLDVLMKD